MSKDLMLKCLIAFILGWLLCRMMGNGFSVGASSTEPRLDDLNKKIESLDNRLDDKINNIRRIQTNLMVSINKSDNQINSIQGQLKSLHEALMKKGIKF